MNKIADYKGKTIFVDHNGEFYFGDASREEAVGEEYNINYDDKRYVICPTTKKTFEEMKDYIDKVSKAQIKNTAVFMYKSKGYSEPDKYEEGKITSFKINDTRYGSDFDYRVQFGRDWKETSASNLIKPTKENKSLMKEIMELEQKARELNAQADEKKKLLVKFKDSDLVSGFEEEKGE